MGTNRNVGEDDLLYLIERESISLTVIILDHTSSLVRMYLTQNRSLADSRATIYCNHQIRISTKSPLASFFFHRPHSSWLSSPSSTPSLSSRLFTSPSQRSLPLLLTMLSSSFAIVASLFALSHAAVGPLSRRLTHLKANSAYSPVAYRQVWYPREERCLSARFWKHRNFLSTLLNVHFGCHLS